MLVLLQTADGSHTIRNEELNETYHSIHGAIQESDHVFIKNGLHFLLRRRRPSSIKILEVGLGTGLNAMLTALDKNSSGIDIVYDAIENLPLPNSLTDQLNYSEHLGGQEANLLLKSLHTSPWEESTPITSHFKLQKICADIQSVELQQAHYDLVYYDAFAPSKQPDVWSLSVLSNVIRAIVEGGILITYCARGQFKRDLQSLSMTVESLSGPVGKWEMVRATRQIFK